MKGKVPLLSTAAYAMWC